MNDSRARAGGTRADDPRRERARGYELAAATDEELLALVRNGSRPALEGLYRRHSGAALRYARRLTSWRASFDAAEDVVAEAMRRVLSALQRGHGPDRNFRSYLFTSVRATAITLANGGREPAGGHAADLDPPPIPDDGAEALDAMSAYVSLPHRWRRVLWATEALDLSTAAAAGLLDSTPTAVAMMAMRAREALRIAYVRQHLPAPAAHACRRALDLLARSPVAELTRAQRVFLDSHVDSCASCERAQRDLDDHLREWAGRASWLPAAKPRRGGDRAERGA